jgi:tetratricopeptide (TPR) repeat protein
MGQRNRAGETFCTLFYPGRLRLPRFARRALLGAVSLGSGIAHAQFSGPACTQFLQAQDAKAIPACKTQVDQAESAPATERMPRIVAYDEYGIALLAIAHQPKQALDALNREIALLPASTVKPDSLQWAAAFWHRATAYQQLKQWEQAAGDLKTAEDTLTRAIAATGDAVRAQHFTQLRQQIRNQEADVAKHQSRHGTPQ